ncbi:MAG: long-chain fatty acid--CoA ligase [Candidatus Rokubacteria bacterium]|nr:long-chain fatty acid--CoA ligase [Candidatus Rokubacteria bacterium]
MNVAQLLERSALYHRDRAALHAGDRRWTYGELHDAVSTLAGGLASLGLEPGERIGLHLPNGPEFVLAYYAAQKVGLVPLSLNVAYKAEEIRYIIGDAAASALVTAGPVVANLPSRDAMPSVRHVLDARDLAALSGKPVARALDLNRDETAAILYTSATTGRPKGVMLTHGNIVSNAYATAHHLRMTAEDRGLCALPMFHCFGQNFILNALVTAGGLLVLQERFVPDQFLDAVARHRITLLYAVPTMYILFLSMEGRGDFSSIRLCFSAAATLPADVERRWHERHGHWIHQGYGLTECAPFASYNHDVRFRSGSIGTPIENVEMKIADEGGRELPDGELGEIRIKGPNVMKGYFGNPQATAEAIGDGWLRSGDIGYRDPDGYYYLVDRVKDMINVSGFKVFPREVEEVLFRHEAVREAAVIGVPDPIRGEAVKAFVVLKQGGRVAADALQCLCRAALASYKVPETIEFIDALPKNPTGKILKKELRARG